MTPWICPKCGSVYGPYTAECSWCNRIGAASAAFSAGVKPSKLAEVAQHQVNEKPRSQGYQDMMDETIARLKKQPLFPGAEPPQ